MDLKWVCLSLCLIITLTHGHYANSYAERIINGIEVNMFPWMVSVVAKQKNFATNSYGHQFIITCGGSIVNSRYVLTAAQCVYDSLKSVCDICPLQSRIRTVQNMRVVVGYWDLTLAGTDMQEIKRIIPHPLYDNCKKENDIALLEMRVALNLNVPNLKLIDISSQWVQAGQIATVASWGAKCNNGTVTALSSFRLNFLKDIVVQKDDSCHQLLTLYKSKRTFLCAGTKLGGVTENDLGGGLWIKVNDRPLLIGLVSMFQGNCIIDNAVYTRLSYYINWLYKVMYNAPVKHC